MDFLFKRISQLHEENRTFCIVTVVSSTGETPRKAGARGIVFPDGSIEGTVGGGSIEVLAIETAQQVLKDGKPLLQEYPLSKVKDGMLCGGAMTLYYEPVLPARRAIIFGGGHVGRAIAQVAAIAGWTVIVVDHRAEVLDPVQFPQHASLIHSEYHEYIQSHPFTAHDWIIIVTHKHSFDQQVLEAVLPLDVAYIGMMGSKRKVTKVLQELLNNGVTKKQLERVRTPIGLNIGKETPGEIAVSIVAEMMAVRENITQIAPCRSDVESLP